MRRSLALTLTMLAAGAALAVTTSPAAAATGPDLRVGLIVSAPGAGSGGPVPIDPGQSASLSVTLDDDGDVGTSATLQFDLTGFDASTLRASDPRTPQACTVTGASTVSCAVPFLDPGTPTAGAHDTIWFVEVDQTTPAATTPRIVADLEPTAGAEADPSDNTADISYAVKATADLRAGITPAPATLAAGTPTPFTLTVGNAGPDTATATVVQAVVQTNDAGFVAASTDPAVSVTVNGAFSIVRWAAGDLAANQSRSTTFTVTAATAGTTATVGVGATSAAYDPQPCYDLACNFDTSSRVTVVAPSPATGSGPVTTSRAPELANTGSALSPALLGLGLLCAGTVVLVAGRRRAEY